MLSYVQGKPIIYQNHLFRLKRKMILRLVAESPKTYYIRKRANVHLYDCFVHLSFTKYIRMKKNHEFYLIHDIHLTLIIMRRFLLNSVRLEILFRAN